MNKQYIIYVQAMYIMRSNDCLFYIGFVEFTDVERYDNKHATNSTHVVLREKIVIYVK